MDELEFRVLGPVEVRRRGQLVPVGEKSLTMLAGLLLSANEPVTVDVMAEWVWGDRPPAHPRAALHNALSRLRGQLGPGVVETLTGGYRLVANTDQLDLLRFRSQAAKATRSARQGALEDAAELLRDALALWREPVLANVDSAALSRDVVGPLTEQYLNCREFRAQVCLRLGWHAVVIEDLADLVRAHPFRESAAGCLMLALLRSGRRADALATYAAVNCALADELGIEPGAALQELHGQILGESRLGRNDPDPLAGARGGARQAARTGRALVSPSRRVPGLSAVQ